MWTKNVTVQAISGTGALRVAGEFLARFIPGTPIYLPNPTWANHIPIFKDSGIEVKTYSYYNPENCGLNFAGLTKDLKVILLTLKVSFIFIYRL